MDVVFIEQNDEEIFCITAKDSTVIRAMQESLKRSEYKYRSFFNLIPDFIFLYDMEKNKIIEANDMVYSNFKITSSRGGDEGHLEDNFMGMSFRELGELGKNIKPGEIHKLETMKIKNIKDENFYVEPNFRLLSFEDHQKQMLVFYKDITSTIKLHELRISHEDNIRELVIARENEKMFNEFFANMSHELRTPINIILSALEMMELSPSDHEKVDKYGQFIRHNAYRLTRIVNNILDITKVDSGFYTLNMKNYELVGFIEDIVTSIVHYAHGKGINIFFDTEEEEYYVAFDMDALE
ncbi:MAG: HAMP domain-containing histidine kinase, partial [Clostridium sp.]|nr:HAMP domain-containing histidine kinase [Clostridium sp.]